MDCFARGADSAIDHPRSAQSAAGFGEGLEAGLGGDAGVGRAQVVQHAGRGAVEGGQARAVAGAAGLEHGTGLLVACPGSAVFGFGDGLPIPHFVEQLGGLDGLGALRAAHLLRVLEEFVFGPDAGAAAFGVLFSGDFEHGGFAGGFF